MHILVNSFSVLNFSFAIGRRPEGNSNKKHAIFFEMQSKYF
jgi:hypothetical protein